MASVPRPLLSPRSRRLMGWFGLALILVGLVGDGALLVNALTKTSPLPDQSFQATAMLALGCALRLLAGIDQKLEALLAAGAATSLSEG